MEGIPVFLIFAGVLKQQFMKKWREYTRQEKTMMIVLIVLLIAVLLNWGRVSEGFTKGVDAFYHTPADTVSQK